MTEGRTRADVVEDAIATVRRAMADISECESHLAQTRQVLAAALVAMNASIEAPDLA